MNSSQGRGKHTLMNWIVCSVVLLTALCLVITHSQAQQLTLSSSQASIQVLSASDLDFRNTTNKTWLFTLQISNSTGADAFVRISGEFDVHLADGRPFDNGITLRTVPFLVPNVGKTITNLDFNTSVRLACFDFSAELENAIRDIALSTGRIPAGTYTGRFRLTEPGCVLPCPQSRQMDQCPPPLISPNQPERILTYQIPSLPRLELLSPQNGAEVPNEYPYFEVLYSGDWSLIVCEILPGQSKEEAILRRPAQLEASLQSSSYQTPPGKRPFRPGVRYAWTAVANLLGPSGVNVSQTTEVREFTIASPASNAATSVNLLNQISQLLGIGYQDLVKTLETQNLNPTGRFFVNNQLMSQAELQNLVNELLRNHDRILGATIE